MYFFYYLPVGMNVRVRRFPVMSVAYSVICVAVFVLIRYFPYATQFDLYNLIYMPASGNLLTAITAAFVHFGYVHLLGNLIYLVFFGRYVEDRMGPVLFSLFFVSSAGIGNYLQGVFNSRVLHDPDLGIIGASGAVSGLMGVFAVRFLRSKLKVAYWVFMPLQAYTRAGRVEIAAILAVAFWFLMQVARGMIQLGGAGASVAYVTHIAGFLWGVIVAIGLGQHREGFVESLLDSGARHIKAGQPYAAQGMFIRYLTYRPDDGRAYASLARAMVLSGNDDGARKSYKKACELLIADGQRGVGESVYLEALRGYEEFTLEPDSHLSLAYGLERNLKADVAVRAYENFEQRYPSHAEAPFTLLRAAALYWHTLSDIGRASACYARLVEEYPQDRWVDFAREQMRHLSYVTPGAMNAE